MFKKLLSIAMISTISLGFVACSDDDDNKGNLPGSNITDVFPEGTPKNVGGAQITTNAQGQVTAVKDGTTVTTFSYEPVSRATTFEVTMTQKDAEYPDEVSVCYLKLNAKGYVEYVFQTLTDSEGTDEEEWWFGYNADGQLNYMKRTEGGEEDGFEVCNVTYAGGNITKVINTEERPNVGSGDEGDTHTIEYTDATVKTPIVNKGGLMLFDETFSIDMDEMAPAYFAGLLGKATKNLPVKNSTSEMDYYTYTWTLNSNGLPVKFVSIEHWGEQTYTPDEATFAW